MNAARFHDAPTARFGELAVPIATSIRLRLLGLSHLDRDRAGPGLLIPRCRSVHTFGMRFALDLVFLDESLAPIGVRQAVPPRRVARVQGAAMVLELPAPSGFPEPGRA